MHHMPNVSMVSHHNLLNTVEHCAATCDHMVTMLLGMHDVHARAEQIQLLRDCVSICQTMAIYLARHNGLSKSLANLCAHVCEVCGNECARFPDTESRRCAQICFNCAQECRAFAAS